MLDCFPSGIPKCDFIQFFGERVPVYSEGHGQSYAFTLDHIDALLRRASVNISDFAVINGSEINRSSYTSPSGGVLLNAALTEYSRGGTIRVSNAQKYDDLIDRQCCQMREELRADVEADLWVSRKNDRTPYLHFDSHDIFVRHIFGQKRWRIYRRGSVEFVPMGAGARLSEGDVGPLWLDVILVPGDALFIPAGTPHAAECLSEDAVHLGFGSHPITWSFLASAILSLLNKRPGAIHEVAGTAEEFADPNLLADKFTSLAKNILQEVDWVTVAKVIEKRYLNEGSVPVDNHFSDLLRFRSGSSKCDQVVRRDGIRYHVVRSCGEAVLRFSGGGTLDVPFDMGDPLSSIVHEGTSFMITDAHTGIMGTEELVVVKEMLCSGFLRLGCSQRVTEGA